MVRNRSFIIFIIILGILLPVASGTASDNFANKRQIPIVESVDLFFDGSITPIRVNLTKDFDFITKIRFHFDFVSASWIPSDFGADDPLENGTATISGNKPLFDGGNLTQNDRLFLVGDVASFQQDDKAPKNTHIYGGVNLFEIIPPYGLSYDNNDSLYFIVQDNLTAAVYAIEEFVVLIMGFAWEDDTGIKPRAPNNPFILFQEFIQRNLFPEIFFFFVAIIVLVVFIRIMTIWKK